MIAGQLICSRARLPASRRVIAAFRLCVFARVLLQIPKTRRLPAFSALRATQRIFGATQFGDVTEAPHPADTLAVDPLRMGIAGENPVVLELEHVVAVGVGLTVQLTHL